MIGSRKTLLFGCSVMIALLGPLGGAQAAGFKSLRSFTGKSDGGNPDAGLIMDSAGNLYGTTSSGRLRYPANCGTVFKLSPSGTQTTLHTFKRGSDGCHPEGSLIADAAGNLYGTTFEGGAQNGGTVFEVAANGTETILYSFAGGNDGAGPMAGLIADSAGNLYGTTSDSGSTNCSMGCGTVFKVSPDGTETVLYAFQGGNDGGKPRGTVLADSSGNLYGTTFEGGITNCDGSGCGIVFKLAPDGTETVLYAFQGGTDGYWPMAGLIADASGNLYGTAADGGTNGDGVVFEVAPDGTETVLYSFGGKDGEFPRDGLIADTKGNLYGTTIGGGANEDGTVFKLAPDGTETVLHTFDGIHGKWAEGGLIADAKGNLYGTTDAGGKYYYWGTVFKLPE